MTTGFASTLADDLADTAPRVLASAFSTAMVRQLAGSGHLPELPQLDVLARLVDKKASLGDAFEAAYRVLSSSYRSEYVYKNSVVSKLVFGRHRPHTANALVEQPMGDSIADIVVVNGTTSAYEIKTDLDDFARLESQLDDYAKHCENVYVVTSEARAQRVLTLVDDHVGVIALKDSGALSTARRAVGGTERLRAQSLFAILRKPELLAVLKRTLGYEPDVPSGILHMRMLELFCTLPVDVAHRETVSQLRTRGVRHAALFYRTAVPPSLRALVYGTPISGIGQDRMLTRLNRPAHTYALTP